MHFTSNSADVGEAIYVTDETYFEVCAISDNSLARTNECFIQVTTTYHNNDTFLVNIQFNSSDDNNSMIFGGLLDRCTLDSYAEVLVEPGDQKTLME